MRKHPHHLFCFVGLLVIATSALAQHTVDFPLSAGTGGALELVLNVDGESATFLLDTGAAIATINSALFDRLNDHGSSRKVREVAARMADGRVRKLSVYSVTGLQLGQGCELGATEVIVVPGAGRNLLGLNVLEKFAPLTLSLSPPALGLSNCAAVTIAESAPNEEVTVAAVSPL
ncbi:retropepsin-like aspartic protease [Congregibacter variabilis]|uniref:Retropepsin-like aspartic protease n=1 Tax=Congregibacter variabilis TaxID=3081200 RepID=A0ABZ0HZ07_9GAMM|nr:retropepsin-like aspartic protease [Congregibacter sp. IMCC43200]